MMISIILLLLAAIGLLFGREAKSNDVFVTSFLEQQITLTCKIDLDQQNFTTSGDYKVKKKKRF